MKNLILIFRVLGLGLGTQILGVGLGLVTQVLDLGLGLGIQVLGLGLEPQVLVNVNITGVSSQNFSRRRAARQGC